MTATEHATTFLRYIYPAGTTAVLAAAADGSMFTGRFDDLELMAMQPVNTSEDAEAFSAAHYTLNTPAPD